MTKLSTQLVAVSVPLPPEREAAYAAAWKWILDKLLEDMDARTNSTHDADQQPIAGS